MHNARNNVIIMNFNKNNFNLSTYVHTITDALIVMTN